MKEKSRTVTKRELAAIARATLSGVDDSELENVVAVLEPLLRECRRGFGDALWEEDPVGVFRALPE